MDFLKKVASSSSVPAGGAAVAYSTCLAIGLIYKVTLFEINRTGESSHLERNLLTVKKEIERLLRDVENLVKEDPESYMRFAQSRRVGDKAQMKRDFSRIIDVSMEVMEKSDTAFEWINQLRRIVPKRMFTHLLVACELLMGAIKGTVHVATDNLQSIKVTKKRENYLKRLNDLQKKSQERYEDVMVKLQSVTLP